MLVASGMGIDPAANLVRESHTAISAIAEKAMGRAMAGAPADAVQLLLDEGERTRNAKLIELAGLVAQRHHDKIADAAPLAAAAKELQQRYCASGGHLIGARKGGRSAGGLSLRS